MSSTEEIKTHLSYYFKGTLSNAGLRVAALLDEWIGLHHLDTKTLKAVEWGHERFCSVKLFRDVGSLATFDGSMLSTLVFLAHDHQIRIEICPCNPQILSLVLHPRRSREGDLCRRHPTVEQAVARWRQGHPTSDREHATLEIGGMQ